MKTTKQFTFVAVTIGLLLGGLGAPAQAQQFSDATLSQLVVSADLSGSICLDPSWLNPANFSMREKGKTGATTLEALSGRWIRQGSAE